MAQVEIIAANLKNNIKNSVKRIIKKVCAYARVSTDSEEQLTSYSSQINHYTIILNLILIGNLLVYMLMRVLVEHKLRKEQNLCE